ncbi:MAG: zinc ribbon domain-containing protein [Acidobacteriota bacterium]
MSKSTVNRFLALEMAHCSNCGYVVEQLGIRTHCAKCNKRLTVRCIDCQTDNPPVFQYCMKCGGDYRHLAVEHYSKQLAKIEFNLLEYQRMVALQTKATLHRQIVQIALFAFTAAIVLLFLLVKPGGITLILPFVLIFISQLLLRRFGRYWSLRLVGMPVQLIEEWQQFSLVAQRQQAEQLELQEQLAYYQQELNLFLSKGH